MTHVHFITHATPHLASQRMRVDTPARLLTDLGFKCTMSGEANIEADVNVFQKHNNLAYDRSMMDLIKGYSARMFDICDDHFDSDKLSDHYVCMSQLADHVTANSPNLIQKVSERTGAETIGYIKDPITFPFRKPVVRKGKEPSLLWFGSHTNFQPMGDICNSIKEPLTVICNAGVKGADNLKHIPWGLGVVEEEIQNHDIVLIPLGNQKNKQNKNTNRAVDAIAAGKFVVTDSERVYGELSKFIFIGPIQDGIFWYKHNAEMAKEMIEAGQEYIKKHYSDEVIAEQWKNNINFTLEKANAKHDT